MEKIKAINPQMLVWARRESGRNIEEATKRIHDSLEFWEKGEDYPTYAQLEKIAEVYRKPVAIFFFSEPPEIPSIKASLRTFPDAAFSDIPYSINQLFNDARVMQINLSELFDDIDPERQILIDKISNLSGEKLITNVRSMLNITIQKQKSFKRVNDAFEFWRQAFIEQGVFVFKHAFGFDAISGFCLFDDFFPVIYVNNKMSFSRQIFTLFHELRHLSFGIGGVDKIDDNYIRMLDPRDANIEKECNQFAADFLVPNSELQKDIRGQRIDYDFIKRLATVYKVSRQVIMIKLIRMNVLSQEFYDARKAEIDADLIRINESSEPGGNPYNTQIAYLGKRYLIKAFEKYASNKIGVDQLSSYTKTKIGNLRKLNAYLRG